VSEIHIFDVVMLRDGGTTSFKAEQCGWITNVKLDTPFRGEPRKLEINFARVSRGQPEVAILLEKLQCLLLRFAVDTIPPIVQLRKQIKVPRPAWHLSFNISLISAVC